MEKIASFPHMANYYVAINLLINKGLGLKTIIAPPITKKTLDLGCKYSPDFVCTPFKYNLGNYIEALESGANVLIQAGGACRFGHYAELQEQILRDLGYEFDFLILGTVELKELFSNCQKIGVSKSPFKLFYYLLLSLKMVKKIDVFEDYLRKNIGFEETEGSFERLQKKFLRELGDVKSFRSLNKTFKSNYKALKDLKINKPDNLIKVGIIGELYTIQDAFSNHFIEKELAKKGVEITRFIDMSYLLKDHKKLDKHFKGNNYVSRPMGATGLDSIVKTLDLINDNCNGIIHVKAFGCTPEINAMPSLQRIARDYGIPILHFSFDSATSETGIKTRIEAFYDMLEMRREV